MNISVRQRIKKAQTDITKKQYEKRYNDFEFDETIKKEKPTIKNYNRSNLIYSSKFSFYEYYIINFNSISLKIQFKFLTSFYHGLIKFYRLILKKESTKEKKRFCLIMLLKCIMRI